MNWGIPDWRDEAAYPVKDSSPVIWAWEFLRRNEEYRTAWLRYEDAVRNAGEAVSQPKFLTAVLEDTGAAWEEWRTHVRQTVQAEIDDQQDLPEEQRFDLEHQSRTIERFSGQELNEVIAKTLGLPEPSMFGSNPHQILGRQFGIDWLLSPRVASATGKSPVRFNDDPSQAKRMVSAIPTIRHSPPPGLGSRLSLTQLAENLRRSLDEKKSPAVFSTPDWQMVAFDLRLPIAPQLKGLQAVLDKAAEERESKGELKRLVARRIETRHFKTYLRVLDATARSVAIDEIVRVLLPHEVQANTTAGGFAPRKKVEKWISAAERLRDADYRRLPISR